MMAAARQRHGSELLAMGAATAHEAIGRRGAMDSIIKPIAPHMRVTGSAFCVTCAPGDNLALHCAVSVAPAGSVLVVDAAGFCEAGLWGDILTDAAMRRGIAGLVIDGAVRDSEAIEALGFPVFARAISIKGPTKDKGGAIATSIVCGGVSLSPGDIIVADRDGVVVIPQSEAADAFSRAVARTAAEAAIRDGLARGHSTVELLGLSGLAAEKGLLSAATQIR